MSYVNYSIIEWGNTYHSYMDKIFKLKNGECELSQMVTEATTLHYFKV